MRKKPRLKGAAFARSGRMVDFTNNDAMAHRFAVDYLEERGERKAAEELRDMGPPAHVAASAGPIPPRTHVARRRGLFAVTAKKETPVGRFDSRHGGWYKHPMERYAFKMKLKPGCEEEYKRRHDEIWPELMRLLSESGIRDYSIYLDRETSILFAVQKKSGATSSQDLADNPIVRKWWDHMADIMETNPDNSPVTVPLAEVFHLD